MGLHGDGSFGDLTEPRPLRFLSKSHSRYDEGTLRWDWEEITTFMQVKHNNNNNMQVHVKGKCQGNIFFLRKTLTSYTKLHFVCKSPYHYNTEQFPNSRPLELLKYGQAILLCSEMQIIKVIYGHRKNNKKNEKIFPRMLGIRSCTL